MTRINKDIDCYLSERLAQTDSLHLLTDAYTAPIYCETWDHGVYTEAALNLDEHQRELVNHVDRAFEDYSLGDYHGAAKVVGMARFTLIRMDDWLSRMASALQSITGAVTKDEEYDTRALKRHEVQRRVRYSMYS